jgi:hypothetical protein
MMTDIQFKYLKTNLHTLFLFQHLYKILTNYNDGNPFSTQKKLPSKVSKNNDPLIAFAPKAKSQSNRKTTKSSRILRSNSKVS